MYIHAYSYVYICAYYTCAFFHLATGIVRELLQLSLYSTSKALSTRAVAVSALLFQRCCFSFAVSALLFQLCQHCCSATVGSSFATAGSSFASCAASKRLCLALCKWPSVTYLLHKVHVAHSSRGRGGGGGGAISIASCAACMICLRLCLALCMWPSVTYLLHKVHLG